MKLVMTLLVRDEEDIIRENIEFHKSQGVDFFIAIDNGSVDNTSNILKKYEQQGILKYIYKEEDRRQYQWVSGMARLAYTHYDADWVINNDADEFWWPQKDNLKKTFLNIPEQYNVLTVERHDFVPMEESESTAPFFQKMVYRQKTSLNPIGTKPLPPKVAHRGHGQIIVGPGNHSVSGIQNPQIVDGGIEIFHFPVRSYQQLIRKTVNIGEAYERDASIPKTVGTARRTIYKEYKKNGDNLHKYYEQHLYSRNRIKKEIGGGSIIEDKRLLNYLSSIGNSEVDLTRFRRRFLDPHL